MRFAELIQPELHKQGFKIQKTDELGLVWTAHSTGNFDLTIDINSPHQGLIAYANFGIDEYPDSLNSLDTWVDKKFRRMGLATKMYNWAQELGNTVEPSKFLSNQGKKFWHSREPDRMQKHRVVGKDRAHTDPDLH
jgi:hypothetical protein